MNAATTTTQTTRPERRHYATHIADMTDAQRRDDIADITALIRWYLDRDMVHTCTNLSRIRSTHERLLAR